MTAALWLGSAFFLMLSASAAFRVAPNATVAADLVGAMLARWHYIALAAPSILFLLETTRARRGVLIVSFVALLLAAAQTVIDLRIRQIRFISSVPVSSLDPDDPVRRRFGALHGASMMLLVAQALAAALVVAAKEEKEDEKEDGPTPAPGEEASVVVSNGEEQKGTAERLPNLSRPDETSGGGP